MHRPSLSYANVMSTIGVFLALGGSAWAVSAPPRAASNVTTTTIDACVKQAGKSKGQLRVVAASKACNKSERRIVWAAVGPAGLAGVQGPQGIPGSKGDAGAKGDSGANGDKGEAGAKGETGAQGLPGTSGSADTPTQILNKLVTVDGQGSGLDASFLDGLDSTAFARVSASATGAIALPSLGAHTCVDYDNVTLGGVDPGDVVIVREGDGAMNLPAGVLMMAGSVQSGNEVHLRFCNVTNVASSADVNVPVRWYAFNP